MTKKKYISYEIAEVTKWKEIDTGKLDPLFSGKIINHEPAGWKWTKIVQPYKDIKILKEQYIFHKKLGKARNWKVFTK